MSTRKELWAVILILMCLNIIVLVIPFWSNLRLAGNLGILSTSKTLCKGIWAHGFWVTRTQQILITRYLVVFKIVLYVNKCVVKHCRCLLDRTLPATHTLDILRVIGGGQENRTEPIAVTIHPAWFCSAERLGNKMFMIASAIGIAAKNSARFYFPRSKYLFWWRIISI